jgi:hypothetical protein
MADDGTIDNGRINGGFGDSALNSLSVSAHACRHRNFRVSLMGCSPALSPQFPSIASSQFSALSP